MTQHVVDGKEAGPASDVAEDDASGASGLSVTQVVAASVLLGAAAVGVALAFGDAGPGPFRIGWIDGPWLRLVLFVMTCLCGVEAVGVRIRHDDDGEAVEELNLLDGVALLSVLLLPVRDAILISLIGILLPYLVRGIDRVKVLYNLGVYATAASATALLVHAVMPEEGRFDARLVVAMCVGTAAFVLVNLLHMALLLTAIGGTTPGEVLREDARLSVLTAIGTVGITGTVLAIAVAAPILLPCAVLPAIALRFAFAASAAKQEERRRSARVLSFSQILASGPTREVAVESFLSMTRQEFDAEATLLLLGTGTGMIMDDSSSGARSYDPSAEVRRLAEHADLRVVESPDVRAWSRVLTTPVMLDGVRVGTAMVARHGTGRFRASDITSLRSLVASLAVTLQNAEQTKRLVEETSKLRAVIDQAGDGIVVLDRDGAVQVWSPAMLRITGVPASLATGSRLGEVLDLESPASDAECPFAEGERRLRPDAPQLDIDIELVRPDGEARSARFSHAAVFEDGALVRDVVIVRDLTAERQVERMKGDFIATVSHELRTPLTPIKGYATMLLKRGDTMTPEKRQRALDVIVSRADHLGRLVEDLLSASTITANNDARHPMIAERADLVALVDRTREDFLAAASRVRIDTSDRPQVVGDPTRVVQIISNLLSNALKYSDGDRPVHVSVCEDGGKGHVVVRDEGAGIPSDQMGRIFDKFHRVEDPMVMSTGGTGLGLYIARQLAHAMGGEITAESTLGQGSTFSLSLPLHRPEHPADRGLDLR